jgi:Na(+)-translocating NADH:ubiquinone oxidoreductase C subunit
VPAIDGYTQATPLKRVNVGLDIERIHVDTIATQFSGVKKVPTQHTLDAIWSKWAKAHGVGEQLGKLSQRTLRQFLITPKEAGGLGLLSEDYEGAWNQALLQYEQGVLTDWNFFLGNKLGCFGETSTLACLLGAIFLIWTGVGSWKTMAAVLLGALSTAFLFELPSLFAEDQGAFSPALFAIPAYKHLLLGGLGFGAVFMATDPVSSPSISASKWIYGILIGFLTIIIRTVNPAFPEGVMLAIILGNVAAPLIDHRVGRWYRKRHSFTALGTLGFIAVLSIVAALVLSLVSGMLKERQEYAKELDRSRQLLLSARIYSPKGYLQLYRDGEYLPAHHIEEGRLELGEKKATDGDIFAVYQYRVRPLLVDREGRTTSYEKQNLSMEKHLKEWKKKGSKELKYLPLFGILPENGQEPFVSYVVPVSGYGLWDRIYGYICINKDGKTVCGIAWYDHQETPGLGGEIASYDWQKQFSGKSIFQSDEEGKIDMETSPLGITVVKGKVEDVLGDREKRKSAVDGISGATLTGNGVMRAYKDSLGPYRPFFERLSQGDT